MIRKPWQIWTLFAICLAICLPPMAWLTVKALELDTAQAIAQRQAELEEVIANALWRMDTRLTPILAQEAARPEFEYASFVPKEPDRGDVSKVPVRDSTEIGTPSRLLIQPSKFVQLSFQCSPDGCVTSPQCPDSTVTPWALASGVKPNQLDTSRERLDQLMTLIDYPTLLARLPDQTIPEVRDGGDETELDNSNYSQVVSQNLNFDGLQRQAATENTENTIPQQIAENTQQVRSIRSQSSARMGNDFNNRNSALQAFAQRERAGQRGYNPVARNVLVRECVSQPLWIGSQLILARRVSMGDHTIIQGCWLNWNAIEQILREEVRDIFPEITFEPVQDSSTVKIGRLLATLPIEIRVPPVLATPLTFSPIRVSLLIAWLCLAIVTVTGALLLSGVVALSERRAAFVSAVTHELRTPLTTFRMYAEMLSEGMVPATDQRRYLQTLQTEADRLSHLVENVLQYARLERGRGEQHRETVTIGQLLDRLARRCSDRAEQSDMKLSIEASESDRNRRLRTDPGAFEQIVFNLIDNACKYAACAIDRRIHLAVSCRANDITLAVSDHGPGIPKQSRRRLFRPFSKSVHEAAQTAPGVGLGLALSQRLAIALGGQLQFRGSDEGAAFELTLPAI